MTIPDALAVLAAHAGAADAEAAWPADSWDALRRSGVLGWIIPREYGGAGLDPLELLDGYQRLAGSCLTTCFLLSQRDSACRRLRDSGNEILCRALLPALASGERFATVGLAQLTTSRQHVRPVLVAHLDDGGVRLDGVMPWVTGAVHAEHFITGVVLEDGRQMLLVVPRDTPGVSVGPPLELMALQGSLTGEVRCEDVRLDRKWVLAGPAERRAGWRPRRRRPGDIGTGAGSCEVGHRLPGDGSEQTHGMAQARDGVRRELECLAGTIATCWPSEGADAQAANNLRAKVNALVLRATQFALAAGKGSGFLRSHPRRRWARQAMFFLVWSCPAPALDATLACMALPSEE